jgi:hypothetical protein
MIQKKMNNSKGTKPKFEETRFSLTPNSTNLILLTSEKGHEIGEQFTMNLLGIPQQALDIPAKQKEELFLISIEIFKKLSKLANAVDKYAEEEAKLVEEFKVKVQKDGRRIAHQSDILEAAIEEVLSQAKSALDVLVKMFEPLLGIKLHTYGENGDKLIKALKNNTPTEDKDKIAAIIQIVELFKPYTESIIGLRTTTQHYKNIQMTPLIAVADEKGSIDISVPKISQSQTAKEYSEIVYHNIFVFIRDLMIFSFASKFYSGIVPVVIEERGPRIKKIGVTISENALKK